MISLGICIAGKRQSGTDWCVHTIEEGVSTYLLGKPHVSAPFAYILQLEDKLRLRYMELVAGTIVVVPASNLKQATEDIDSLPIGKNVGEAGGIGIQCRDAIHWFLLYTIVGRQLGDELIHEDRAFVDGVGG